MEKVYRKFNSFIGIRVKKKFNLKNSLNNLKLHLNDKKGLLNLNKDEIKILDYLKKDLFKSGTKNRPKFILTPNVVKEIETLNFADVPRYLVHRYRY